MVLNFHLYSKVSDLKTYYIDPYKNKLNNNYYIPELKKITKHFIPNWKIMIYTYYHATSKEMLAMHVQQTKNATPYKKHYFKNT